jgi:hypothetical protein
LQNLRKRSIAAAAAKTMSIESERRKYQQAK